MKRHTRPRTASFARRDVYQLRLEYAYTSVGSYLSGATQVLDSLRVTP